MLDFPNGVRPDRRARRREQTRREILDAAWELSRSAGLNGWSLRDVADRIGMRAPSLYTHVDSKLAIYDLMYAEAWRAYEEAIAPTRELLGDDLRAAAHLIARGFFDFAVSDPVRYQLMNQRVVPGFEPSPESYAPAVRVLELGHAVVAERGLADPDDFTILISTVGGLIDQQVANDPGGDRMARLLPRAVDLWADGLGLPSETDPERTRG